MARGYLAKVKSGEVEMYLPAIALVETGIVVSRITNNEEDSRRAVSFLRKNASRIFYEHEILDEAICYSEKPEGRKRRMTDGRRRWRQGKPGALEQIGRQWVGCFGADYTDYTDLVARSREQITRRQITEI